MESIPLGCRDPESHDEKWLVMTTLNKGGVSPCLACAVLTLEDRCQLSAAKRCVLSSLLDVLHNAPELVVKVISDEQVAFHSVAVILDIMITAEESLASLAAECVLLLLCHLKNEKLGLAVMERLTTRILAECNYQKSMLDFQVLGRLLFMFPDLAQAVLKDQGQFLHYMATGLTYPCDKIRSTVLYNFLRVYSATSLSKSDASVHAQVIKGVLFALKTFQEREVLKNALALLKVLVNKETKTLPLIMQMQHDNINFATSLKKILLSNDPVLQISAVQCICHVMKGHSMGETYSISLMDASIPEFLFEILSTANELLTESILCSIYLFTEHPLFFTKYHAIYGVESVIRATDQLLINRNWRLCIVALQLLAVLFSSCQSSVSVIPNDSMLKQVAQLLDRALKLPNQALLISSSNVLHKFLRKENLPNPIPTSLILSLVETCLSSIYRMLIEKGNLDSTFLKMSKKKVILLHEAAQPIELPSEFKLFESGLHVINACVRLATDYFLDPAAREESFSCPSGEPINQICMKANCDQNELTNMDSLINSCLVALDVVFIPCCLHLGSSDELGQRLCADVVNCLCGIYEEFGWKRSGMLVGLTHKLFKAGFIKLFWHTRVVAFSSAHFSSAEMKCRCFSFLKWMLLGLMKHEKIDESYLSVIEIGIEHFESSFENCVAVLSQKCDMHTQNQYSLKVSSSQLTIIYICYASFLHGDIVISIDVLLPHLVCFVTLNADEKPFHIATLKHLVFLLAFCSYEVSLKNSVSQVVSTGLIEANCIVRDLIQKLPSFGDVYTPHEAILWWCFMSEDHSLFSHYVIQEWLKICVPITEVLQADEKAGNALLKLLVSNKFVQLSFLSCLEDHTSDFAKRALMFLKLAWDYEVNTGNNASLKKGFLEFVTFLFDLLPSRLINMIMSITGCQELNPKEVVLTNMLNILLWCKKQLKKATLQLDMELKLCFHISTYCSAKYGDHDGLISCYRYLRFIFDGENASKDNRIWHIICGNKNLMFRLQEYLNGKRNDYFTESLKLVVAIFSYQLNNAIKSEAKIHLSIIQPLLWLSETCCDLQYSAMQLFRYSLKMEFRNTVVQILTPQLTNSTSDLEEWSLYPTQDNLRVLFVLLQNIIAKCKPLFDEVAVPCMINLLEYSHEVYPRTEQYLMLQPWTRLVLESRLASLKPTNAGTLTLFEKWLDIKEVNVAIIRIMQRFADLLVSENRVSNNLLDSILMKLCQGTYSSYISAETKHHLQRQLSHPTTEDDNNSINTECYTYFGQSHSQASESHQQPPAGKQEDANKSNEIEFQTKESNDSQNLAKDEPSVLQLMLLSSTYTNMTEPLIDKICKKKKIVKKKAC